MIEGHYKLHLTWCKPDCCLIHGDPSCLRNTKNAPALKGCQLLIMSKNWQNYSAATKTLKNVKSEQI